MIQLITATMKEAGAKMSTARDKSKPPTELRKLLNKKKKRSTELKFPSDEVNREKIQAATVKLSEEIATTREVIKEEKEKSH